jgi:hypothetical protein
MIGATNIDPQRRKLRHRQLNDSSRLFSIGIRTWAAGFQSCPLILQNPLLCILSYMMVLNQSPWLWTIIPVLKRLLQEGFQFKVRLGDIGSLCLKQTNKNWF